MRSLAFTASWIAGWLLAAGAPAAETTAWTGRIELVESIAGAKPQGDAKEAEALAKVLQERVVKVRERLKTATPTVARTLRGDLAHLDTELEQLAIERGGTIVMARTRYAVGPRKTLVDGDDARVVIDRVAGVAAITAGGRVEELRTPAAPAARELADAAAGPTAFGVATTRGTLKAGDLEYRVTLAPGLPNSYALGLVASANDALPTALAGLPGLPVEVELKKGDLVRRWTVTVCSPEAVIDAEW